MDLLKIFNDKIADNERKDKERQEEYLRKEQKLVDDITKSILYNLEKSNFEIQTYNGNGTMPKGSKSVYVKTGVHYDEIGITIYKDRVLSELRKADFGGAELFDKEINSNKPIELDTKGHKVTATLRFK